VTEHKFWVLQVGSRKFATEDGPPGNPPVSRLHYGKEHTTVEMQWLRYDDLNWATVSAGDCD